MYMFVYEGGRGGSKFLKKWLRGLCMTPYDYAADLKNQKVVHM